MGYEDEGNADLLLDPLQLVLHFFAKLQIQGRQRLVQKQHLRLVDQGPGDGHTLLLSAGQQSGVFIFIALQTDEFQHLHNFLIDDVLTHFLNFQSESDIFIDA